MLLRLFFSCILLLQYAVSIVTAHQQDHRRHLLFGEKTEYTLQGDPIPLDGVDDVDISQVAVARHGTRVAVLTRLAAKVYEFNNSNDSWQQVGGDITDLETGKIAMSADGSTVAFSISPDASSAIDRVVVYRFISNVWTQVGDTISGSGYMLLSTDSNLLAIRQDGHDWVEKTEVRVYKLADTANSSTWSLLGDVIENSESRFLAKIDEIAGVPTVVLGSVDFPNRKLQVLGFQQTTGSWAVLGSGIDEVGPVSFIQGAATKSTPCRFRYELVDVFRYTQPRGSNFDEWLKIADLVFNDFPRYSISDDASAVVAANVADGIRVYVPGDKSAAAGLIQRLPRLFMERINVLFQWPPRIFDYCGFLCPSVPPACRSTLSRPNFEGL